MTMTMNQKAVIIIVFIALVVGLFWITSGSTKQNTLNSSVSPTKNSTVKLVSSQEFATLIKDENAFVIDVHTPEQTHIPGTDAVISFDQIRGNIDKLPADKSTPILVYCQSGNMSARASSEIVALGYTTVYDLEGGTNAYKESNVSVSLTPDTKALGTVVYGDVAEAAFTLTNYTPLPLKITRVSTSCGCTKASVEKDELEAYESTTVNVSFDPAVHEDDTDLGDLTRTIYVETDNPNFPDLESTITATVIKKN